MWKQIQQNKLRELGPKGARGTPVPIAFFLADLSIFYLVCFFLKKKKKKKRKEERMLEGQRQRSVQRQDNITAGLILVSMSAFQTLPAAALIIES